MVVEESFCTEMGRDEEEVKGGRVVGGGEGEGESEGEGEGEGEDCGLDLRE